MAALKPMRRKMTARKLAEKLGVSERTVQRLVAEPREEYEARARSRREQVAVLRAEGKTIRAIADELGISHGLAGIYAKEAAEKAQDTE